MLPPFAKILRWFSHSRPENPIQSVTLFEANYSLLFTTTYGDTAEFSLTDGELLYANATRRALAEFVTSPVGIVLIFALGWGAYFVLRAVFLKRRVNFSTP